MTLLDAVTWVTIGVLGPGVLVLCIAVARDVRRLLGGAATPVVGDEVAGRTGPRQV